MFCRNCGKPLDDSLKFCPSCGEQTDQIDPTIVVNNSKTTRGAENAHDYANDMKEAFNCFISYIISVVKTPTMTLEIADTYLTKKKALAYTAILAIIYSIIQCILFKVLYSGFLKIIDGFTSQIPFGFGDLIGNQLYSQNPQWFKLFALNILFIVIFVCSLSLLSLLVYTLIMKKTAKLMDFVKIYLNSLVLLVIISLVTLIAAAINLKLMLAIATLGSILYIISIAINFVNFLKNETKVIYTLPVIIFLSLFLTYYIYIKLI